MHSYITYTPIFDYEILEKKFLCIIHSDILEFVVAKFKICSNFIGLSWLEIKIYIVYIFVF